MTKVATITRITLTFDLDTNLCPVDGMTAAVFFSDACRAVCQQKDWQPWGWHIGWDVMTRRIDL